MTPPRVPLARHQGAPAGQLFEHELTGGSANSDPFLRTRDPYGMENRLANTVGGPSRRSVLTPKTECFSGPENPTPSRVARHTRDPEVEEMTQTDWLHRSRLGRGDGELQWCRQTVAVTAGGHPRSSRRTRQLPTPHVNNLHGYST